ncbi:glycosyl hydrolase [Pelomyxa schiedti]|nr:glycosyl hydrolase [Pelomyxa schiedti]
MARVVCALVLVLVALHAVFGDSIGDMLYMYPCSSTEEEMVWNFDSTTGQIISQSGYCVEIRDSSTADGGIIQLNTCAGSSNQRWSHDSSSYWAPFLSALDSLHCVDISGPDSNPGAYIHSWSYLGLDNQLWHYNAENGTIVSKLENYCIKAGELVIPTCLDTPFNTYVYCDDSLTPDERVADLLPRLTLDEKLAMVHGYGGAYAGTVRGNANWAIPTLTLEDGPQGVADGVTDVTCYPSALTVCATWDPELMREYGAAMAIEQLIKGTNIMLGPMENIARVPVGGRNFESVGEDAYLGGVYAKETIIGIQSQGVIATAKHYLDNNQEYDRTTVSAIVDDKTQHELYLSHFRNAIDAGAGAVMCSYNLVNGTWACENDAALNHLLKDEMAYKGFVMSDWGATHSVGSANAGLDMEMPGSDYFGTSLANAVADGTVPESRIDDMATRILRSSFAAGLFDRVNTGNIGAYARSAERDAFTKTLAEAATILLKNSPALLPLITPNRIAVIGSVANDSPIVASYGSGYVVPPYVVTPYQGITTRVAQYGGVVKYDNGDSLVEAAALAATCDVAVVVVGCTSSEGADRDSLKLGNNQDELIRAIIDAQPNTIVVINSPGAVTMPWIDDVSSVVEMLMPGQEDGNALASILFGDVNPSGKLPVSFPVSDDETWLTTKSQYPGVDDVQYYTEGRYIGYSWYDSTGKTPLFSFGHGLSYTQFDYTQLMTSPSLISFALTNNGTRSGAEVAQLYIGFPASAGEPVKLLRGFQKVFVPAGQSVRVSFNIDRASDLTYWDTVSQQWVEATGTFLVYVGSSSTDIRLNGKFFL